MAKITKVNIADACQEYTNIFAANKNLYRVTPSMIDGLKPGMRRLMYIAYLNGTKGKYRKVAFYTGLTMAHLHPHADTALNDALVLSAREWVNNVCLFDKQGNFGTIKGEDASAGRYIEAKLSHYSYKCFFEEFKESPVDMKDNFDGEMREPEYLPSRYPNGLINGTLGIGTGMATNIPPYNLSEVLNATIALIKNPNTKIHLVPDSPSGCYVIDDGNFKEISEQGIGKYRMRGVFKLNEAESSIDIKSLPYNIVLDTVVAEIVSLVESKKIEGIDDIKDNTNKKNGLKCHIKIKHNANPDKIIEKLYKSTSMEKTYPVNMIFIDEYKSYDYNIRSYLLDWLENRRECKRGVYNYKLMKSTEDYHLNKIILFILSKDNVEKTIKILRRSRNKQEVVANLMEEYKISSLQAAHIYDAKMSIVTGELAEKARERNIEIEKEIERYNIILEDDKEIDKVITEELQEGINLFGEPRRSQIIDLRKGKDIKDTTHYIIISQDGYVKKYGEELSDFGQVGKDRAPCSLMKCSNRENLLIFDSKGYVSKVRVASIPDSSIDTNGTQLSRFVSLEGNIVSVIRELDIDSSDTTYCALLVTKDGFMKKTPMSEFAKIKDKKIAISMDTEDEVVSVEFISEMSSKDILIYTNCGDGVRLDADDAPLYGHKAKGLRAISLCDDEYVTGLNKILPSNKFLFYVTKGGKVKVTEMKYFPKMKRKSDSMSLIKLDNDEEIFCIKSINKDSKIKIVTRKGTIVECDVQDFTPTTRIARAEKFLKGMRGDEVIAVAIR